jgi:signal recognition particle GTPase
VVRGCGKSVDEFNKLINEWERSKEKFEQVAKMIRSGKNPFSGSGLF